MCWLRNNNKIGRSSDLVMAANTPFIINKELPGKLMQMRAGPPSGATTRKVVKIANKKVMSKMKKRIERSRKGKARSTTRTS